MSHSPFNQQPIESTLAVLAIKLLRAHGKTGINIRDQCLGTVTSSLPMTTIF